MCRNVVRIFVFFLAVFIGSASILTLTIRTSLLQSSTYIDTLRNTGVYSLVEEEITGYLPDRETEQGKSASIILDPILENIDVEVVVQDIAENNVINITRWLNSSEDLFIYFPKEELINSYSYTDLEDNIFSEYKETLDSLDVCTQSQLDQLQNSEQEDILPFCIPPEFDSAANKNELSKIVTDVFGQINIVEAALKDANLDHLNERTPITDVIQNQPGSNLDDSLQVLQNIKTGFYLAAVVPIIGLFVTAALIFLVAALGRPSLKTVFTNTGVIGLIIGSIVAVVGLFGQTASGILLDNIPFPPENLPIGDADQIQAIVESILTEITYNIFQLTVVTGAVIIVISIVLIVISILLKGAPKVEETKENGKTNT